MGNILFGSVCSGIEAASVAWHPLGWRAAWVAEIEPFPSAVLAHHYPTVPNLGDMTKIAAQVRAGQVAAPDVLVGGTPCQAFSVAGLRNSLDDARGQLTLSYVELANAIDDTRADDGKEPCIIVWENVPGVLNTKDNAFGCFLAGLAGEDDALVAPGGKWSNAGAVFGPQRSVAWRVTDAQYFGVAQRRRRVFVVASARDGFDPCEVLFEFDGVRRDTAPSREAGQEVAGTLASRANGGGFPGSDEAAAAAAAAGYVQPVGGLGRPDLMRMAHGQGGAEIRIDSAPTLTCNHEAPIAAYSVALRGRDGGATAELGDEVAGCLRASGGGGGDKAHVPAPIAFQSVDYGGDATFDLSPTIRRHDPMAVCITGDVTHTLKAEGFDASEDGTGRGQPIVATPSLAFCQNTRDEVRLMGGDGEIVGALTAQPGMKQTAYVAPGMAVRRLTPVECERLQAFPDGYTMIPLRFYKNRRITATRPVDRWEKVDGGWMLMAADGPRYKALGNSMCVNNMRWIGQRIDQHLSNPFGDLI